MYEDEWVTDFCTKVSFRLRETFEHDLGELPVSLARLLQKLREREEAGVHLAA